MGWWPFRQVIWYAGLGVGDDSLRLILVAYGSFLVRSYYQVSVGGTNICFPWKAIWWARAPTEFSFFAWCVWLRTRVLPLITLFGIGKLSLISVECVCELENEWRTCFPLSGCEWALGYSPRMWEMVFLFSVIELIQEWFRARVGRWRWMFWSSIPICLMWVIWRERCSVYMLMGCRGLYLGIGVFSFRACLVGIKGNLARPLKIFLI